MDMKGKPVLLCVFLNFMAVWKRTAGESGLSDLSNGDSGRGGSGHRKSGRGGSGRSRQGGSAGKADRQRAAHQP